MNTSSVVQQDGEYLCRTENKLIKSEILGTVTERLVFHVGD